MATLIVASTTSGAGKTTLAAGIAALLEQDGRITASRSSLDLVEGSSGDPMADLKLAEKTDALVVLVCGYNDDVPAAAAPYGSRLAGVIINNVPIYRRNELDSRIAPQISAAGIKLIGWLPEDRRLLAPTVDLVAEHLDGILAVCPENKDRLIDNFLIGGLVLDWGPHYFGSKENVGVVVRGDRPDVQLAALQTDTVRALVLTKGIPPIEYVYYEAESARHSDRRGTGRHSRRCRKTRFAAAPHRVRPRGQTHSGGRVDQDPSRPRRHKGGRQSTRNPLASQARKRAPQD